LIGKNPISGSGMSESLETIIWVKILNFFHADADSDPGILLILDAGSRMEKIQIRDKHPGSATLQPSLLKATFPYNNALPVRNSTNNIWYVYTLKKKVGLSSE
jgi:hypothetical protein